MSVTIVATAGASNANSYVTLAEANAYFDARVPLTPPWADDVELDTAALVMAARVLDSMLSEHRRLVRQSYRGGVVKYYLVSPHWTGTPTTTTQALAWPRDSMFDALGRVILNTVIPQGLKNAQCELAGQLRKSDRTIDNDVSVQGVSSVKAGSVSVTFKDTIEPWVVPDMVWNLMCDTWFTDEIYEPAVSADFGIL